MRIRYRKIPDLLAPEKFNHYPYLQVLIRYKQPTLQLLALVDSGAIETLLPATLGVALGIDVLAGDKKVYFGIGGQSALGYRHECNMRVQGLDSWIKLTVGFLDTIQIPILGQLGFFEHYQVLFERFRYQF